MGTRSVIAVMHGDNAKAVSVHWDGYLEGVGAVLLKHYDSVKANHLISLGDVSSLGSVIGEKHPFSPFDRDENSNTISVEEWESLYGDMTTFYGRDRGETGVDFKTLTDFNHFLEYFDNVGAEFAYIMRDGVWYYFDLADKTPRDLSEALTALVDE